MLARERETILEEFVDKSDRFATTLVEHGTFGFLPDIASAYTQPLYGWFLAGLYLPFGHSWLAVGLAQTLVAVATALLVFEIGTMLRSPAVGLVAALLTTLHPYVVWHDVHANREVLDGLLLALLVWCVLLAYEEDWLPMTAVTGGVAGLAILGNARLAFLPVVLGVYVAWRVRPGVRALATVAVLVAGAALVVSPWVARNEVEVGCYALTTDARALEGEQPEHVPGARPRRLDRRRPRAVRRASLAGACCRPDARGTAHHGGRVRADAPLPR